MSDKKSKSKIEIPSDEETRKFGGPVSSDESEEQDSAADAEPQNQDDHQAPAEAKPEESLEVKLQEAEDKLLRAKAETQNVIRRAATEKSNAIRFANEGFAKALLPVLDDFERSLQAADEAGESGSLSEGVKLVYEKLTKAFADNNVTEIEAEGKPFNPEVHHAVMKQPSADHDPNTVLHVLQKGYVLYDRVIRPTQVVISDQPADQPEEEG